MLEDKVALVTGASRGLRKGVVLGLCEAGATVYLTGRSTRARGSTVRFRGTIEDTAEEASALGGEAIPVECDHADDAQTKLVADRIRAEQGRLDVLVNNAWGGYEYMHRCEFQLVGAPFWTRPLSLWDEMFVAGPRAPEAVLAAGEEYFDFSNSESPQFIGRAVAALAADPGVLERSGQTLVPAELAAEYGFTDVDGKLPRSVRAEFQ